MYKVKNNTGHNNYVVDNNKLEGKKAYYNFRIKVVLKKDGVQTYEQATDLRQACSKIAKIDLPIFDQGISESLEIQRGDSESATSNDHIEVLVTCNVITYPDPKNKYSDKSAFVQYYDFKLDQNIPLKDIQVQFNKHVLTRENPDQPSYTPHINLIINDKYDYGLMGKICELE